MIKIPLNYDIKKDINTFLEAEHIDMAYLSEVTKISRVTLDGIINEKTPTNDNVYEKFYSYLYTNGYRLNKTKEELLKERTPNILFHGSKEGLTSVSINGARKNCDFGNGFYLGETYFQALAFIYEKDHSSIYSFSYRREDLNIKRFECDLEWMLAICYHRGTLQNYKGHPLLQKILRSLDDVDLIVAPIANNRMFYIMSQFVEGEINADVALHSLSASSLGLQYIFRSEKALQSLSPIEKYYVSLPERKSCKKFLNERALMIDTKLKLAKREYKNGLYIEEILK
mgnify:CR=1 FL=1